MVNNKGVWKQGREVRTAGVLGMGEGKMLKIVLEQQFKKPLKTVVHLYDGTLCSRKKEGAVMLSKWMQRVAAP